MQPATRADAIPYPAPVQSWYVVSLLTLAYIISFIDRQILSLLITPIKDTLVLSDFEIGLLLGPAFAVFYVTLGYPIGWLADRKSRRAIIGWGIAVWCVMTAACGIARNFPQLFLARIGVGIGEATLTPSALSLISDLFPKERRARAVSVYMMGISLGGGLAYIVGGKVVALVMTAPSVRLPFFGELYAWQTAFLVVGLPGLLIAALMLTVREPARQERADLGGGAGQHISLRDAFLFILARWQAYGALFFGMCVTTICGYAAFWNVALFQRTWGWDVPQIGLWLGIALLIFGPLGTNIGGWISDIYTKRGIKDGPLRATFIGVLVLVPAYVVFPLFPSPWAALAVFMVACFGGGLSSAAGAAAVVTISPNQVRAQATAIYWLVINLAGLFLGPPLVGWITGSVFGDPAALRYSLSIVPAIFGVPSILILWLGLKPFALSIAEVEALSIPQTPPREIAAG